MDGVAGISQPLVPTGQLYTTRSSPMHRARSSTTPTTAKSHAQQRPLRRDRRRCRRIRRRQERASHRDYVEIISSWTIQSLSRESLHDQRQRVSRDGRRSTCARASVSASAGSTSPAKTSTRCTRTATTSDIIARDAMHASVTTTSTTRWSLGRGNALTSIVKANAAAGHVARALPRHRPRRRQQRPARRFGHGDPLRSARPIV